MNKRIPLVGAMVALSAVVPTAGAAQRPQCQGPGLLFTVPAPLQPAASVLPDGSIAVDSTTSGVARITVLRAATGSTAYTATRPGGDAADLVVDAAALGNTSAPAIFSLSAPTLADSCQHLVANAYDARTGRLALSHTSAPVESGQFQQLVGAGAGGFNGHRAVVVESREYGGATTQVYSADYPFRDETPVAEAGWVSVVDEHTGGELLHLEKPHALGPGPITGFFSSDRGNGFAALLDSTATSAAATSHVVAYRDGRRVWSMRIPTLPVGGQLLNLRHGPAFVTNSFVQANGQTLPVSTARVSALDGATGRLLWQIDLPASESRHFYELGGDLLAEDYQTGQLEKIDATTGAVSWQLFAPHSYSATHFVSGASFVAADTLPLPEIITAAGTAVAHPEFANATVFPTVDLNGNHAPQPRRLRLRDAHVVRRRSGGSAVVPPGRRCLRHSAAHQRGDGRRRHPAPALRRRLRRGWRGLRLPRRHRPRAVDAVKHP